MNKLIQYGLIAVVVIGFYIYNNSDTQTYVEDDIDLNAVLDVTVDTIYAFQESLDGQDQSTLNPDNTFVAFTEELQTNYNAASPKIYEGQIGVLPQTDASVLAYDDLNNDGEIGDNEPALFLVEIDGERSRVIASSRSGAVNDHHFSGAGLLTGYLIGSMLNRQRAAGVTSDSLAKKQPVTARAAAKSRAGSGSHAKGK
jgi:hypothetical protein